METFPSEALGAVAWIGSCSRGSGACVSDLALWVFLGHFLLVFLEPEEASFGEVGEGGVPSWRRGVHFRDIQMGWHCYPRGRRSGNGLWTSP